MYIKSFIFLTIFSFIFISCSFSGNSCDDVDFSEVNKYKCETEKECVEKFDTSYTCYQTENHIKNKKVYTAKNSCVNISTPQGNYCKVANPSQRCVKDICSNTSNICGLGECILKTGVNLDDEYYDCNCQIGSLYVNNEENYKCIENTCRNTEDCTNKYLITDNIYSNRTKNPVFECSNEGKCIKQE